MSGIGDCASQEIEASTSSNSTRNSKKFSFVQSILNTENTQNVCSNSPKIFFGREKVPELPILEKNDFIKNWIIAHNNLADSPEKLSPDSPILGISSSKRSPQSPILGYQWKRIKREEGSKENCRVSLSKKFQKARPDPLVNARITIQHENPRYSEPEIILSSNNDSDKTLTSVKSPVLNRNTNSPILNTRPSWFGETKSPTKFDVDSTLKWNDRKSLVRDSSKITESLSLSSPLCERNNPFKIADDTNYPKQSIEAVNKHLLQFSELLVEESPFDVEIISSSSKIPETLSHSTIGAEYVELNANSKNTYSTKYDFQANEDIHKLDRLHRSPSSSNSIKFKAETSSNHDRRSQSHESSNSSVRLSISSPLRHKKLIGVKSCDTSWIRAKTSSAKLENLQVFDHMKKIQESSPIPDTLSVSSQLQESLVPEPVNYLDPLSIPSPLRNKKVIVSSPLAKSLVPKSSDSPDRLSISSSLRRKTLLGIKSTNTSWIRAKNSCVKSEALGTLQELVQSKKCRESSQIPDTLSVSSQLDEILVPESVNYLNRLSIASPLRNEKTIVSSPLAKSLVPESSDSPDRLSISSSLKRKKLLGIKSTNTSLKRGKKSCVNSETLGTLQGLVQSKKSRESLQIPETLSVSSQLDEIIVAESSSSPNQSSRSSLLAKNVHVGISSVNTPWIREKGDPTKFEAVVSSQCIKRLIEIRESSKISNTLSERIDVESSTTNAPEDDIKIESDSDGTISDFIENVSTQNCAAIANRNFSEPAKSKFKKRDRSSDSDETYYSDGDSIPRLQIAKASPLKNSQQISQSTSHSNEGRVSANRSDIAISQAASPLKNISCEPQMNIMSLHTTNNDNKKKKKGKKGSLLAKLQTIVNSQVSNLRIWRYQMSQPDFKNARTQFVKLKIRERETRFGRHYLRASVIEDSHNLLKSLFESESNLPNEKSGASSKISIVTLMMVPEIIGVVKIRPKSIFKIYPPWEIMDRGRKILNVTFFNVGAPEEDNFDSEAVIKRGNKNIIQEFECPCIRAKTLVDSCRVKFSNTKPSVMQAMFSP